MILHIGNHETSDTKHPVRPIWTSKLYQYWYTFYRAFKRLGRGSLQVPELGFRELSWASGTGLNIHEYPFRGRF